MNEASKLPCDHVISQLWEYLDGDLSGDRAARVQEHLDLCARCFPEYDFRQAYLRFMRRCAGQQVPTEVRRRVFEAILREEHRGTSETGSGPNLV